MKAVGANPGCGGSTVAARRALPTWYKPQIMPESPHRHLVVYLLGYCPECWRVSAELIDLCRRFEADTEMGDVLEHLEQVARRGCTSRRRGKLAQVETRLNSLRLLRNELRLPLNLRAGSEDGCPILKSLDSDHR